MNHHPSPSSFNVAPVPLLYFVRVDFGGKIGRSWVERDDERTDRKSTIEDIASGQFGGDVIQVLECCTEGPICNDVSEDIAGEVGDIWARQGSGLTDWQHRFIEGHLGVEAANAFAREDA